ncbi:glutamine--scyllo-inositol aminotransferase, partial [bacterium]
TARKGVAVIEDAAQAIGSRRQGRLAGSLGDIGVFSFHGTKTLTTGEGGMLVTDREDVYRRVLFLRDHGREPGDRSFYSVEVAHKYKISALQAALGSAQLSRIDELVALKRRNFYWYREEFPKGGGIRLNPEISGVESTFWLVTALFEGKPSRTKEGLLQALRDKGIEGRPFFYPLSSLPAYSGSYQAKKAKERNLISYRLSPRGINLPSAMNLNREQVHYVAQCLRELL